jgi:hypothetical protein
VTLCMAVACEHEDEPRIVLCNDWKEEVQGVGSSEHTDKLNWIADGWPVLTAGTSSQIEDLIRLYRTHLAKTTLTELNFVDELKHPAQMFKGALAEDYIQQMMGMSYSYLLDHGKNRLPEEFFRERISEVARLKIQASLIITGFLEGAAIGSMTKGMFPVICVVEDNDEHENVVREEIHFASIGSGAWTANASLYNREVNSEMPLLAAIYSVFEAHRWSEKVPGVGESLSIDVLEPGGILRGLSNEGSEYCEFLWKRYGPKEPKKKDKALFDMKEDYLDPPDKG